jgi:hypothetical protein
LYQILKNGSKEWISNGCIKVKFFMGFQSHLISLNPAGWGGLFIHWKGAVEVTPASVYFGLYREA